MQKQAIQALELRVGQGIPHSIIMCSMGWNFTPDRIDALVDTARKYQAHIRINYVDRWNPTTLHANRSDMRFTSRSVSTARRFAAGLRIFQS